MKEQFIIFVRDIVTKIGASFEVFLLEITKDIANIPYSITIVIAILSLTLLLRIPFLRTLSLIPYLIIRPLLRNFGIISNTEPWSVVYDSRSKFPLDPVYISIRDMLGREVASAVTDLEGRFGIVLPRGTYTMTAQKTNYSFPSVTLKGKKSDGFRNQLYFGERITILDEERVLAFHIPLDPVGEDWNQKAKKRMGLFGVFRRKKNIAEAGIFFSFVGSVIAITQYVLQGTPLSQKIVLGYGIILSILFLKTLFQNDALHHSVVLDKKTQQPLSFARVKIFTKAKGFEVSKRITTLYGQFVCLLPPGEYVVTIEKRLSDGTYELVHTSNGFTVKDGYIHKKFVV